MIVDAGRRSSKFRRSASSPREAAVFSLSALGKAEHRHRNRNDQEKRRNDDATAIGSDVLATAAWCAADAGSRLSLVVVC